MAAKSTRSKFWFVRVDGPKEFLQKKANELAEKLDTKAILGAYHTGKTKENPHIHFVIELDSEPQKQSFAVRMKTLFNIEKRSQYAIDTWDGKRGAGACSYLFHEQDADIVVNKGFDDSDIDAAKQANEITQRVMAANKERASGKYVEKALAKFEGQYPNEKQLLEYMMTLAKDGELYWPGTYKAKQLIEEVQIKLCGDSEFEFNILVDNLARKMWP